MCLFGGGGGGHLYVFFRPGVEHGGDVASIMDGDEESSVKKPEFKPQGSSMDGFSFPA